MRQITDRQAQVLLFIEKFIDQNGYSPSIREIAEHFQMSAKGAYDHVWALIRKEYLIRQPGKSRTIKPKAKNSGGDE